MVGDRLKARAAFQVSRTNSRLDVPVDFLKHGTDLGVPRLLVRNDRLRFEPETLDDACTPRALTTKSEMNIFRFQGFKLFERKLTRVDRNLKKHPLPRI